MIMRLLLATSFALLASLTTLSRVAEGQRPLRAGARDARPPTALCDSGTFRLTQGGAAAGEERFGATCHRDGRVSAHGHTTLTLANATLVVATALELDAGLRPRSVTVNGSAPGRTQHDTIAIADSTATVRRGATELQLSTTPGAAWVGNNTFFTIAYLIARHDARAGGAQAIPVFPKLSATVEPQGSETLGAVRPGKPAERFDRFGLRIGPAPLVVWRDSAGRVAAILAPAAGFAATHERWSALATAFAEASRRTPAGVHATIAPPDYSAPAGARFTAEEVTIPAGKHRLAGTLVLPSVREGRFAAAITITGSGQQTRDESLPGLERYRPMREIAERLAAGGIAVLRVDDRGVGSSTGAETLAGATTRSFAEDVRAQIAWLRTRPEIDADRIALIGHSEGGAIAPMVAADDPRIAALVLMAAPGMSGARISLAQQQAMLALDTSMTVSRRDSLRRVQEEAIRQILAGSDSAAGQPVLPWVREYFAYDPLPTIRRARRPLLILQGGRDVQVAPENAELLAGAARESGNEDVTVRHFPSLNHLFLPSATGAPAEYATLVVQSLPDDVLGAIAGWLAERLREPRRR